MTDGNGSKSALLAVLSVMALVVLVGQARAQATVDVDGAGRLTNEDLERKTKIVRLGYFVENADFAMAAQHEYARANDRQPWLPEEELGKLRSRSGWDAIIASAQRLQSGESVVFGLRDHKASLSPEGGRTENYVQLTVAIPGSWKKYETSGAWYRYEIDVGGGSIDNAVAFWSSTGHQATSCYSYASGGSIKFDRQEIAYRYVEGVGIRPDPNGEYRYDKITAELTLDFLQVADGNKYIFGIEGCRPFSIHEYAAFWERKLDEVEWHR